MPSFSTNESGSLIVHADDAAALAEARLVAASLRRLPPADMLAAGQRALHDAAER